MYEISLADPKNPTPSGKIAFVWSGIGPGMIFDHSYWQDPGYEASIDVRAVHFLPFRRDLLMVTYTRFEGNSSSTSIKLFGFNQYLQTFELLSIGTRGHLSVEVEENNLTIVGYFMPQGACNACGEQRKINLQFDRDSGQLMILNPTQASVQFFEYLKEIGSRLN